MYSKFLSLLGQWLQGGSKLMYKSYDSCVEKIQKLLEGIFSLLGQWLKGMTKWLFLNQLELCVLTTSFSTWLGTGLVRTLRISVGFDEKLSKERY